MLPPGERWLLASRRRVALVALALLLVLDLGRSLFARFGYSRPTSIWQPDPAVYADLTWPPGADLPPDVPLGRRVYAQRCIRSGSLAARLAGLVREQGGEEQESRDRAPLARSVKRAAGDAPNHSLNPEAIP